MPIVTAEEYDMDLRKKLDEFLSPIPAAAWAELGHYVYGLYHPGRSVPFYIGVGSGDRARQHFGRGEILLGEMRKSEKVEAIRDAFRGGNPEIKIIRHKLESRANALALEAALIDVLRPSLSNRIRGHSSEKGIVTMDELIEKYSPHVNPSAAYPIVFIFNIAKELPKRGGDVYEATRRSWPASKWVPHRAGIAIGLDKGFSRGAYSFASWSEAPISGRWMFTGQPLFQHELLGRSFSNVISKAIGYWQRGNYLVAEFDGKEGCRLLRGAKGSGWFDL